MLRLALVASVGLAPGCPDVPNAVVDAGGDADTAAAGDASGAGDARADFDSGDALDSALGDGASDAEAPGGDSQVAAEDAGVLGDAAADVEIVGGAGDGGCVAGERCELGVTPSACTEGRCNTHGTCVAAPIPGCCLQDDGCAWLVPTSPCQARACVERTCALVPRPGCCVADADCDDATPCTEDRCGEATGLCTSCPVGCACGAAPLLNEPFDGDSLAALGFTVQDGGGAGAVTWSLSTARAVRPPGAAYLGDPSCATYYNGALDGSCVPVDPFAQDASRVSLSLRSPAFTLPEQGAGHLATFWIWSEVEPFVGGGPAEPDVLRVFVVSLDDGLEWEVASSLDVGKRTAGGWRLVALDLAPWRGRAARLRFDFDTLDGQANDFEGIYLDDLRVAESCTAGGCCETDADCAGGAPDACTTARCVTLTSGAGRFCAEVPATPGAPCTPCEGDAGCEDGDACTTDTCVDGGCRHDAYCCLALSAVTAGFDDADLDGWAASALDEGGAAWSSAGTHAFEGDGAAWFGVTGGGDYDTGAAVAGSLTSPPLTVPTPPPSGQGAEVAFALWLSTEWDGAPYANPAGLDRLALSVVVGATEVEIWSSDQVGGTTGGAWLPVAAPLDPWIGLDVQLRFTFDSVDGNANAFEGPWIDALQVRSSCP